MAVVQYTFTHKQYVEQHDRHKQYMEQNNSLIRKSADRAPSLRGIPWHLQLFNYNANLISYCFSICCLCNWSYGYCASTLIIIKNWFIINIIISEDNIHRELEVLLQHSFNVAIRWGFARWKGATHPVHRRLCESNSISGCSAEDSNLWSDRTPSADSFIFRHYPSHCTHSANGSQTSTTH